MLWNWTLRKLIQNYLILNMAIFESTNDSLSVVCKQWKQPNHKKIFGYQKIVTSDLVEKISRNCHLEPWNNDWRYRGRNSRKVLTLLNYSLEEHWYGIFHVQVMKCDSIMKELFIQGRKKFNFLYPGVKPQKYETTKRTRLFHKGHSKEKNDWQ